MAQPSQFMHPSRRGRERVENAIDPSLPPHISNHTQLETKWVMLKPRFQGPNQVEGSHALGSRPLGSRAV